MDKWIAWGHHTSSSGERLPVGQPLADLTTHMLVSGTTGSGKSTLLRNLALQAADAGATVIVIEPHGDLVLHPKEGIVAALTDDQLRRTTVVDLASDWPPQMNLVTSGIEAGRSAAVAAAMNTIRTMDDASYSVAIQMRSILENALYVLMSRAAQAGAETSLLELQKFLEEATYREQTIRRARADALEAKRFWDRTLLEWSERKGGGADILAVPLRRTSQFLRDDRFRRSLALPALAPELALNIGDLMDGAEARILLVPLQGPLLGETAKRVFGTLFLQAVTNTLLARGSSGKARRQTVIIIDEFPDFAGEDMGELVKVLLAQARKFGASVILGVQFLAQLPRDVQDEVRANCNNKIALATQDEVDAKAVVKAMASPLVKAIDVQNIERWHGYARLRVKQAPQPPFYFATLAPLPALPSSGHASRPVGRPPQGLAALAELHARVANGEVGAVVEELTTRPNEQFAALVEQQVRANRYSAQKLLSRPDLMPDPVARALAISRTKHGLPWWFYEAQYRRLREK